VPQIHADSLYPFGMNKQRNMVLDSIIFETDIVPVPSLSCIGRKS